MAIQNFIRLWALIIIGLLLGILGHLQPLPADSTFVSTDYAEIVAEVVTAGSFDGALVRQELVRYEEQNNAAIGSIISSAVKFSYAWENDAIRDAAMKSTDDVERTKHIMGDISFPEYTAGPEFSKEDVDEATRYRARLAAKRTEDGRIRGMVYRPAAMAFATTTPRIPRILDVEPHRSEEAKASRRNYIWESQLSVVKELQLPDLFLEIFHNAKLIAAVQQERRLSGGGLEPSRKGVSMSVLVNHLKDDLHAAFAAWKFQSNRGTPELFKFVSVIDAMESFANMLSDAYSSRDATGALSIAKVLTPSALRGKAADILWLLADVGLASEDEFRTYGKTLGYYSQYRTANPKERLSDEFVPAREIRHRRAMTRLTDDKGNAMHYLPGGPRSRSRLRSRSRVRRDREARSRSRSKSAAGHGHKHKGLASAMKRVASNLKRK